MMYQIGVIWLCVLYVANANCQPLVVDDSGNAIAIYLDTYYRGVDNLPSADGTPFVHALSPNSYSFMIRSGTVPSVGDPPQVSVAYVASYWITGGADEGSRYFETDDCSGQAYVFTHKTGYVTVVNQPLGLNPVLSPPEIWYVPKDEPFIGKTLSSRSPFRGLKDDCEPVEGVVASVVRIFPNDPAETAVTTNSFDAPIRIEAGLEPQRNSCIFRNGFECLVIE